MPPARRGLPSSKKFARHYFPGGDAAGRHLGVGANPGTRLDIEIIGVVRDTRYQTMRQEIPRQVYFPYLQNSWAANMTAFVRSDVKPDQIFPIVRAAVRRMDANVPVYQMKTYEKQRDDSLAVERLAASLAA